MSGGISDEQLNLKTLYDFLRMIEEIETDGVYTVDGVTVFVLDDDPAPYLQLIRDKWPAVAPVWLEVLKRCK
jgi:predicted acetyltransferase